MTKFNRAKLSNGLTVIHEKRDVPVTTVMMAVRYGSMYESAEEKGIAHFIEHLCFKGTEKRNVREIAVELEGVGGELNAFTSEEMTAYHVKLPSRHLELGVDVIGDIFFNAAFPKDEIEKEAGVICEEIKMYYDNPRAHCLQGIVSNLYEAPFGVTGLGSEQTVLSMTREQLISKHRGIYIPKNSVLCVVGNNAFDEVLEFANKYVNVERAGEEIGSIDVKPRIVESEEKRSETQQSNMCLGFHFPHLDGKSRYAAILFSSILGEGMSSKLFSEVREKRGLVYGVKSDLDIGRNYGYMVIWAGTKPENVEKVKRICLDEFAKIKDLTEKELADAKIMVLGSRIVDSEGSNEAAVELAMEEFSGKAEDYYSFEKFINSVSLEDLKELAKISEHAFFSVGP
jgi:predicted Zn-dependent peptidase